MGDDQLKRRTASTLKWNLIDKLMQQVLYAVTGIVLARMLSQEDFGLVGAVLIFQAFASLLIDSGFSFALMQRKEPTHTDYSSVFWFNMGVSVTLYIILYLSAPLIAMCFQNDQRIIPLSRVLFMALVINASSSVQTCRLLKNMDARLVAMANASGLAAGAVAGIYLAVTGAGAWAIVWQTLVNSAVKSLMLWFTAGWRPGVLFDRAALRSFIGIGSRMAMTSFLNTVFLNLYSLVIGAFVSLRSLGYYSQSDKWSKMGIMSISQTLTSSFMPALSAVQDDPGRFKRVSSKMNRFTAYILFPATIGLMALATPIFHVLFGTKWDPSILLFQLLLARGIFTVLNGLYNNYLLALNNARAIVWLEVLRDVVAIGAIAVTFPYMALTTPDDPVYGLTILLWGQLVSSAVTYVATLIVTCRTVGTHWWLFVRDLLPYMAMTLMIVPLMLWGATATDNALAQLIIESVIALTLYLGLNRMAGSQIQRDVLGYLSGRRANTSCGGDGE